MLLVTYNRYVFRVFTIEFEESDTVIEVSSFVPMYYNQSRTYQTFSYFRLIYWAREFFGKTKLNRSRISYSSRDTHTIQFST